MMSTDEKHNILTWEEYEEILNDDRSTFIDYVADDFPFVLKQLATLHEERSSLLPLLGLPDGASGAEIVERVKTRNDDIVFLLSFIVDKDLLLAAYRVGNQRMASKALDRIDAKRSRYMGIFDVELWQAANEQLATGRQEGGEDV